MYTLFYSPGAASMAVHQFLIELGQPFEARRVDLDKGEQKQAAYLAINPAGVVPALLIDSRPYTECAALLLLLAERHPDARLAPALSAPERPEFLQWTFFLANTMQPLFRRWFYPQEAAGAANEAAAKDQARMDLEAGFDRIDKHLGEGKGFMAGECFTVLDLLMTMLLRWSRNMPKPANRWPHIKAYIEANAVRPSWVELHAREGLEMWPPKG